MEHKLIDLSLLGDYHRKLMTGIVSKKFEQKDMAEESDIDLLFEGMEMEYTLIAQKQNMLVSGVNIKTINGQSLLGSGDINISPIVNFDIDTETGTLSMTSESLSEGTSFSIDEESGYLTISNE